MDKKLPSEGKQEWEDIAEYYEQVSEINTLQTNIMLYNLARVREATRICEVGAGAGLAPRILVSNIMQPGSCLFVSDLSKNMVKALKKKFESEDMLGASKIKTKFLEEFGDEIEIDIDNMISSEKDIKQVFMHEANSEKLPYPSNCFDRYISNLCLMLVGDYKEALKESYRVLQEGGTAAFTVIGRRDKDTFWKTAFDALKAVGIEDVDLFKDIHDLSDRETLKQHFEEVGYTNIKMTYIICKFSWKSEEAFKFTTKAPVISKLYSQLSAENKIKYEEEFMKLSETSFGAQTFDFPELEMLLAFGQK